MSGVLVGNINPGYVTSDYMRSLMDFMIYDINHRNLFKAYLPWRSSALADIYRNMVVEQFLSTDLEYLWFLDSDIEIDNSTLYKLLDTSSPTRPVVSGIYPTIDKYGQTHPSLWYRAKKDGKMTMIQYEKLADLTPQIDNGVEFYTIDGVGAGCLLIHRSLLEEMRHHFPPAKPWFDMGTYDGIPYGEDYTFCMRIKELGISPVACPTALVDHYKEIKLTLKDACYASCLEPE